MESKIISLDESDKSLFLLNFLQPLIKITDRAALIGKENWLYSIQTSDDNTLIVYSRFDVGTDVSGIRLNLGDINRFVKLIESIPTQTLDLIIKPNHILFENKEFKFKYHLLDDAVLPLPPISSKQIHEFIGDDNFEMSADILVKIAKFGSMTPHSNKIYLYTNDQKELRGELTDRAKQNVDSIDVLIHENVNFVIDPPLCFNLDQLRLIHSKTINNYKFSVQTKTGLVAIDCKTAKTVTKYILTTFVK